jgi:hypothetical protein
MAKYKLVLVVVQEVRRENGCSELEDDYTFFYVKWNSNHHLRTGSFVHKGIRSAIEGVKLLVIGRHI